MGVGLKLFCMFVYLAEQRARLQTGCMYQSLNILVSKKLDMKNGWSVHNMLTNSSTQVSEQREEKKAQTS